MSAVSATPPPRLVAAQRATIEATEQVLRDIVPGQSEVEIVARAEAAARARGASGFWTPVAAGAGAGNRVCHPDHPPTERTVGDVDLVYVDLTPEFGGWPGDVTRSVVVGSDPAREALLADCLRVFDEILAAARPGMPASELFGVADAILRRDGLELLDLLSNIGHDLGEGAAVTASVDAANDTPLWGCWAIEPHVGRDGLGAKHEELVWFGPEGVHVLR